MRLRKIISHLRKRPLLAIGAGACVVVTCAGLGLLLLAPRDQVREQVLETPVELSDLALRGLQNEPVNFSQKSDHVRVIGIFASWCPYCKNHLRMLSDFAREHTEAEVVAVNRAEQYEVARAYLDGAGAEGLTLLLDPTDSYYHSVGGKAMPEVVIADKSGRILTQLRGPMSREALEEAYRTSVE